ncbi:MAG: sulfite exporter TauE/SafE family protein [Proteobacteria bacterium]|nr:sulfite exporter TauE/SafE family protein [Pseudomonadota bacterium]
MDFTIYWFMFPVSICIATTAMMSGIGGAAFFMPIFLIIFPLLGPEYPLASPVAAIGVALLTETFGFSSGFVGYFRKQLIDFRVARALIVFAVPAGIIGALLSHLANPEHLKLGYGALMVLLAYILFRGHGPEEARRSEGPTGNTNVEAETGQPMGGFWAKWLDRSGYTVEERRTTDREGKVYVYEFHRPKKGSVALGLGGFLTGLLSVGIGEVVMPLLIRRYRFPVPVAAATSILVVIVTVMSASFAHISSLIAEGGWNAVPWNVVCYTIPAVIIGGQIGPRLQGVIPSKTMEKIIASLFLVIGTAMLWIVFRPL